MGTSSHPARSLPNGGYELVDDTPAPPHGGLCSGPVRTPVSGPLSAGPAALHRPPGLRGGRGRRGVRQGPTRTGRAAQRGALPRHLRPWPTRRRRMPYVATMSSAGRSMNTLLQSLPALIGATLGALGSYIVTYSNERYRWQRTRASRWDERRLLAYVDYGSSIRRMNHLSARIAAARELPGSGEPLPVEEGLVLLAAAEADRAERWQAVLILGHPKTIRTGHDVNRWAWTLEWFARGKLHGQREWNYAWKAAHDARDSFFNCARVDLGIAGGDLPKRDWSKEWKPGDFGARSESS